MYVTLSVMELVKVLAEDIKKDFARGNVNATCKVCGERLCASSMKLHYNTKARHELFNKFFGISKATKHADMLKKNCKVGYEGKYINFVKK